VAVSPGKFILFGEHAVVYGEPAIAVAIDLPFKVTVTHATVLTVDGRPVEGAGHPYVRTSIEQNWTGGPVAVTLESRIPRASGLGSSAALSSATIAALGRLGGATAVDQEKLARSAFEVEYKVQDGKASPTDTSTVTHGSAVMLAKAKGQDLLWHIKKPPKEWYIHHLPVPAMTFVIGNTNAGSSTPFMVKKVAAYYKKSGLARETVAEIGTIAADGAAALKKGDLSELGRLMDLNHKRLANLGVSTQMLDKLVEACRPHSYGAKLTGKGGGGCMVALTDKPDATVEAIKRAGGTPLVVQASKTGVRLLD